MTKTKTKIKYTIQVPILYQIFIERDEPLTEEQLWESVTQEELLDGISEYQTEEQLIHSWKSLGTDEIDIFNN